MFSNQKKAGIVIAYATEAVKILTKIFYTPIMLHLLGNSEYGLYDLVNSVVSYLGLLSLGLGSAYMRFYSRCKAKKDEKEIARLNGMFLVIFSVISIVCLLCGTMMVFNIDTIFKTGLTAAEVQKARILMTIMIINMAITFPNTVFNNSITAHERFFYQKGIKLLHAFLNPFLALPLLLMGYGSVGLVVLTTCLTVGELISNVFYCAKKLKIKFLFSGFRWELFSEMFVFTFFIFMNQIIDRINWNVDRYLLGTMINTTAVTMYGVGALLNSLYIQMSTSISNVFVPQVNRIVAENNDNWQLTQLFIRVGRLQFIILALIMTGVVFFGQSFVKLWVGRGYETAYFVALLLMVPETVPLIQNLGIEVQYAKNMHQVRSIAYFIMAILNIFISISLIRKLGVVGAAAGTSVSLVLCNCLFMNWYYQRSIGLNVVEFWESILSLSKGLVFPLVLGTMVLLYVNTEGIVRFLLFGIVYSVTYFVSMWRFGFNQDEKVQFNRMLGRFRK